MVGSVTIIVVSVVRFGRAQTPSLCGRKTMWPIVNSGARHRSAFTSCKVTSTFPCHAHDSNVSFRFITIGSNFFNHDYTSNMRSLSLAFLMHTTPYQIPVNLSLRTLPVQPLVLRACTTISIKSHKHRPLRNFRTYFRTR